MKIYQLAACVTLSIISSACFAYSCSNTSSDVDDAQRYLKNASQAYDLDSAKSYMRRARNALDDVVNDVKDCGCDSAASEFDDASTYSRRARDASAADDFNYQFQRTVKAYNAGISALNTCARTR